MGTKTIMSSLFQATEHAVSCFPCITNMPLINSSPLREKRVYRLLVSFNPCSLGSDHLALE